MEPERTELTQTVETAAAETGVPKDPAPAAESTEQPYKSPEQIEYEQAQAAVKAAEEAAAKAATDTKPEGTPAADVPAQDADKPKDPKHEQRMVTVPEGTLIAMRKALTEKARREAELEGENRVLKQIAKVDPAADPAKPAEPVETPEQKLERIKAERKAVAERFDAGEINAAQWREQDQVLEDSTWEIRQSQFVASQPQVVVHDLSLEEHTSRLEETYPVLKAMDPLTREPLLTQGRIDALTDKAYEEAAAEGTPIRPGAEGTKALRERVAKLATKFYGTPSPTPPTDGKPSLSPTAIAREEKIKLAERLPPDVGRMGSPGSGVAPSEADILAKVNAAKTEAERAAIFNSVPGLVQKLTGRARL